MKGQGECDGVGECSTPTKCRWLEIVLPCLSSMLQTFLTGTSTHSQPVTEAVVSTCSVFGQRDLQQSAQACITKLEIRRPAFWEYYPCNCPTYRIVGNFHWVQIFVIFADRPASTKIKTTKKWTKMEIFWHHYVHTLCTNVNKIVLYSLSAL